MGHIRFAIRLLHDLGRGGPLLWGWSALLIVVSVAGALAYWRQFDAGLQVTGMTDQVMWGLYIGNFTFLVGIAAAAVVLVVPTYVFHLDEMKPVVLLGESMAVAAVVMSLLFVFVDLGQPLRIWHALPYIGSLNFPTSILAWDMLVLSGYLVLNIGMGWAFLYSKYRETQPHAGVYYPFVIIAIVGGIAIHTVTAFMLAGNAARPFWHTAVLAPRFIASAFAAGSAIMIILFQVLGGVARFSPAMGAIRLLSLVLMFALLLDLFLLGSELFVHFYPAHAHTDSAEYLFMGLDGANQLTPWIWAAVGASLLAALILVTNRLRHDLRWLNVACLIVIPAVWMQKGLGLIVPGFVPTPLGEVMEYAPTATEIAVSLGIWAFGALIFTWLARATVAVESGRLRSDS